jgi:hypothetical protein
MTQLPKVIERRFSKRAKAGGSHSDKKGKPPGRRPGVIYVDPRQTPRDYCETLIHETLHECCPYLEEYAVQAAGDTIERVLNRAGYQLIYPKDRSIKQ